MLLPLRPAPARPGAEAAGAGALERARRVLVVDDNRDSADTMVHVLGLLGHEARAAYGAAQAAEVASSFAPQVVLLDLNMPDGDGFAVMRQLRAQSAQPLYIAAMTGYGQKEDRASTLEAGFQAHLTKPIGAEQLRQTLRDAATFGAR